MCFSFCHIVAAGPSEKAEYKVRYFQQSEIKQTKEHPAGIRIEIGLDKPSDDFKVYIDPDNNQMLMVDLNKTRLTKVKKVNKLDGKIADQIVFDRIDRANSRALISSTLPLNRKSYKVYTLPYDDDLNKPFRIVIDLFERQNFQFVAGLAGKKIVLDAGHGGSDVGAVGPGGLKEKDVTLDVTFKVGEILKKAGAKVTMTRSGDYDVYSSNASATEELQARVDVANQEGADILVSIHANSFTNTEANGTATYYYEKSTLDELLAQNLQDGLAEYGKLNNRGIVQANFYIVKRAAAPAALVELAFISNYNEEQLLGSEEFRESLAEGICKGLSNYFVQTKG